VHVQAILSAFPEADGRSAEEEREAESRDPLSLPRVDNRQGGKSGIKWKITEGGCWWRGCEEAAELSSAPGHGAAQGCLGAPTFLHAVSVSQDDVLPVTESSMI